MKKGKINKKRLEANEQRENQVGGKEVSTMDVLKLYKKQLKKSASWSNSEKAQWAWIDYSTRTLAYLGHMFGENMSFKQITSSNAKGKKHLRIVCTASSCDTILDAIDNYVATVEGEE